MDWWHLRLQLEIPFVFHQCSGYVCWAKGVWEPGQCCLPQCWVIARHRERETGWVLRVICGSHVPFIAEICNPLGSVIRGMTESLPRVWSIKVCSVSESTNTSSEWVWELTVSFVYFTHQYPYSYWQALLFWWHRSGINEMLQNSSDSFLVRPSFCRATPSVPEMARPMIHGSCSVFSYAPIYGHPFWYIYTESKASSESLRSFVANLPFTTLLDSLIRVQSLVRNFILCDEVLKKEFSIRLEDSLSPSQGL